MKKISFIVLLLIALHVITGCAIQKKEVKIQSNIEYAQWVEQCLHDFESIKPGMSRQEVEQKFPMDGGVQTVSPVRFTHPQCQYFKVNVSFEFKRDANDQNRAIFGSADKVTKVSNPYIERPFAD